MIEIILWNDYGCDDFMDGVYNILKFIVLDKNDYM